MSHLQSRDAALFVYLAWDTRGGLPVLASEELRQAAYLAITTRTRSRFCHILAIGGTAGRIQFIAQIPPSLSVFDVARMAQEASGLAVAHQSETYQGRPISRDHIWDRDFLTHTLRKMDAADAEVYLRQQIMQIIAKNDQLALNFIESA